MDPTTLFETYQRSIEAELRAVLQDDAPGLYEMMRYHLGWVDAHGTPAEGGGGKGLRPTLCLLACRALTGDYHQALPAAAAVELVHNFSLIHDDIQDGSPERRHRPTVWRLWGVAQAINAGDGMYALAQLALLRLRERAVPAHKVLSAQQILGEACLRLCEGQYLDIHFEDRLDISVSAYLDMIGRKSAALMASALHLGALLGSDNPDTIDHFRRFGWDLGLAFQIRDDVLGIWGEEAATGKPTLADLLQRKKSLPVVFALETTRGKEREELHTIYAQPAISPQAAERVLAILNVAGAQEYAQAMGLNYYRDALAELESARLRTPAIEDLKTLAHFLVERSY